jgi:N,N'-diacetyllegionaminate synthase
MKTTVIAEAGVNHNGSMEMAEKLVFAAKFSGADIVKFQTFNAKTLVTQSAPKARYQINSKFQNETQFQMLKRLELSEKMHRQLIKLCNRIDIGFLSTAFDQESVDLLRRLGQTTFKIPSGEITNLPLLRHIAKNAENLILSTGASTMFEIEQALEIIYKSGLSKEYVTVLHCTSAYPAPLEDVNLSAMQEISRKFEIKVGYSDHTLGTEVSIAAVALGASIIEKHFTMSKNFDGPDHKASLEPDELESMIRAIRKIEKIIGTGIKKIMPSEKDNLDVIRKSIVAKIPIVAGEVFTDKNLTTKRPGSGISPMYWDAILGNSSRNNYAIDEMIKDEL